MKLTIIGLASTVFVLAGAVAFGQAPATTTTTTAATNTAPPPKNPWDASAAVGLTLTRGNSKTVLLSGSLQGTKKWDQNEVDLGADGVYGEANGVKNAASIHGSSQYNRLFTDRFFGYIRLDGLHDGIADIDYRLSAIPGAGYYFIKATNTTFRGEIGPGVITEQDSAGTNRTDHTYMTLRLAERFDQKLSANAKLWESLEFLPEVDKLKNYIANFELGVEASMSKSFSLQTVLQDSYHSEPAEGRLKNDLKLIAGVKYKF